MKFVPKIFFFRAEYARAVLGNYDNGGLKNIITRMPNIIDKWRELDKQVTRNDVMMMIMMRTTNAQEW